MKKQRGSITIMASIIFLILVILSGTLIDAARLTLGYSKALRAFESSSRSVLGNYQTDLKDTYGLFALRADASELELQIGDMTSHMINPTNYPFSSKSNFVNNVLSDLNLNDEDMTDEVWKIWNYDVSNVDVTNDINAIIDTKNQILEYVKYRAPITLGEAFLNKLDVVIRSSKTAEVMESKVELDDTLSSIDDTFMKLRKNIDGWGVNEAGDFSVVTVNSGENVTKESKFIKSLKLESIYSYSTDLRLQDYEKSLVINQIKNDNTLTFNNNMFVDLREYLINKTKFEMTDKILSYYEMKAKESGSLYDSVKKLFVDHLKSQTSGMVNYSIEVTESEGGTTTKTLQKEYVITEAEANAIINEYFNNDIFLLRFILQWPLTIENTISSKIVSQNASAKEMIENYTLIFNDSRGIKNPESQATKLKDYVETLVNLAITEAKLKDPGAGFSVSDSDSYEVDSEQLSSLSKKAEQLHSELTGVFNLESRYKEGSTLKYNSYTNNSTLFEAQIKAYLELTKLIVGDVVDGERATGGIFKELADKSLLLEEKVNQAESSIENNKDEALSDGIESTQWSIDYAKNYVGIYDVNSASEVVNYLRNTEMNVVKIQRILRSLLIPVVDLTTESNDAGINKDILESINAVDIKDLIENYKQFGTTEGFEDFIIVLKDYLSQHSNKKVEFDQYFSEIGISQSEIKLTVYDVENKNNESLDFVKSNAVAKEKKGLENNAKVKTNGYTGAVPSEPESKEGETSIFASYTFEKGALPSSIYLENLNASSDDKTTTIDYSSDKAMGKSALKGLSSIGSMLGDIAVSIRDNLYINEYILNNFKHRLTEKSDAMDFQGMALKDRETVLNFEVEYIINGVKSDTKISDFANDFVMSSKIYGVRFAMNFLHVMITPEKRAVTLSMATAIAGWWTAGLGIPIVQVGISALWAALESSVDIMMLQGGHEVAFYKLLADWYTFFPGVTQLTEPLLNATVDPIIKKISSEIDDKISKVSNAIKSQIPILKEQITGAVDEALAGIEGVTDDIKNELKDQALIYLNDSVSDLLVKQELINTQIEQMIMLELEKQLITDQSRITKINEQIDMIRASINASDTSINSVEILKVVENQCMTILAGSSREDLKERDIVTLVAEKFKTVSVSVFNTAVVKDELDKYLSSLEVKLSGKIDEYSEMLKDKINESLESTATLGKEKVMDYLKNDVFTFTQKNRLKKAFDVDLNGERIGKDIKSSAVRFSYEDYLRLFLLLTNENKKIARTMDLIQANVNLKDKNFTFSNSWMSFDVKMKINAKSIFRTVLLIPGITGEDVENRNATFNLSTGVTY